MCKKKKKNVFVFQYEEAFQKVTKERDQISQHYQQYIEQLSSQHTQLQTQVATLIEERESLVEKQTETQSRIHELESKQSNQGKNFHWNSLIIASHNCTLSTLSEKCVSKEKRFEGSHQFHFQKRPQLK